MVLPAPALGGGSYVHPLPELDKDWGPDPYDDGYLMDLDDVSSADGDDRPFLDMSFVYMDTRTSFLSTLFSTLRCLIYLRVASSRDLCHSHQIFSCACSVKLHLITLLIHDALIPNVSNCV